MEKYCNTYPFRYLKNYMYVVIVSKYEGKLLLSRHKARTTFETQGGHIEKGETVWQAAMRELYEESGALEYTLLPVCDYRAGDAEGYGDGAVFAAHIHKIGTMPPFEIAEIQTFDTPPSNEQLTYPWICPVLLEASKSILFP